VSVCVFGGLLLFLTSCSKGGDSKASWLVFAAASTADPMSQLATRSGAETSIQVRLSFGASSDLARQIKAIEPKVVPMIDVRAELTAVENEAASVDVVYRSDAQQSKKVRVVVVVPLEAGPKIVYPGGKVAPLHPAFGFGLRPLSSVQRLGGNIFAGRFHFLAARELMVLERRVRARPTSAHRIEQACSNAIVVTSFS